ACPQPASFSPGTTPWPCPNENLTHDRMNQVLRKAHAEQLKRASLAHYQAGQASADPRGIIIADTKFEFGTTSEGTLLVINEILTPDSSRFWPAERYRPGRSQPRFDKQPLRDYLAGLKEQGEW